jgi:hypothetical protein
MLPGGAGIVFFGPGVLPSVFLFADAGYLVSEGLSNRKAFPADMFL